MKRSILAGAVLLLTACGDSSGVSIGTTADSSATSPAGTSAPAASTAGSADATGDTISVETFGDMPQQCIDLLAAFLKQIEPVASTIDWDTATLGDFEAFGNQFSAESQVFDDATAAAGCDKFNVTGSDDAQIKEMAALAAAEAPGTVGFINFLGALSSSADAAGSVPGDCTGLITEIEPYLTKGSSMTVLTMTEITRFGQLMNAVRTTCSADEADAFFGRDDVTAFISN